MAEDHNVSEPGVTYDDGDRIACPHGCGHYTRDLWDFAWDRCKDGVMITECPGCRKPIDLHRVVAVSYVAKALTS